jgi:hypothetical protein
MSRDVGNRPDDLDGGPITRASPMLPGMFIVSEEDAAAIRTA